MATIYGNLSPEVRRAQAQRFRDGEADVVVAGGAEGSVDPISIGGFATPFATIQACRLPPWAWCWRTWGPPA